MKKIDYQLIINKTKSFIINHALIISVLLVASSYIYLFVVFLVYKNGSVATTEESSKSLRIDKSTVDKLNSLQDNSVQVQAIFNDARNNPF